jgi:uncharacterized phage protein (TIGR02218 family)
MKEPVWEVSSGSLIALLNSATALFKADLYAITLLNGTVLRYTSAGVDAIVNGVTYSASAVISRGPARVSIGAKVDSMNISISAASTVTVDSVPLMQLIANGGLDGARIRIETAYAAGPNEAWNGSLYVFSGRVSEIQSISRIKAEITIASDSELLNSKVPRNVYQPGCMNTLYDPVCGVAKTSNSTSKTATSTTDTARTTFSFASGLPDQYALGKITCVTGPNANMSRTIKSSTTSSVTVIQPWPFAVQIGNQFTLWKGCDKTKATCESRFNNLIRFRGMPFVPAPETIV